MVTSIGGTTPHGTLVHRLAVHLATVHGERAVEAELAQLRRALDVARPGAPRPGAAPPEPRYGALLQQIVDAMRGPLRPIAAAIAALPEPLCWYYHYEASTHAQGLCDRIGFAELIGPDAAWQAPGCRVGFTLMAADTLYPLHAHPAVELYWVLAGEAEWQTAMTRRNVPPGHFVLHRSGEPHAMRTFGEPLLALWSWSGDIDTPAAYLEA